MADQPHCVLEYAVWGALGSCSAESAAIQAVSTPGRGTGVRWTEQSDCQHVNVTACDPMPGDPAPCAEWDFLSGGKATTFLVPMDSTVGRGEWQIFETGELLSSLRPRECPSACDSSAIEPQLAAARSQRSTICCPLPVHPHVGRRLGGANLRLASCNWSDSEQFRPGERRFGRLRSRASLVLSPSVCNFTQQ